MKAVARFESIKTRLKTIWSARMQDMRARYVVQVLLIGCGALFFSQMNMSNTTVRYISFVLSGIFLGLLWAFIWGMSVNAVVYVGASVATLYLCMTTLLEGGIYSSTLVWLPLLALAVFFVIHPKAGRWWVFGMLLIIFMMGAISFFCGEYLPATDVILHDRLLLRNPGIFFGS